MNIEITEKEAKQITKYHTNKLKSLAFLINHGSENDIKKLISYCDKDKLNILKQLIK